MDYFISPLPAFLIGIVVLGMLLTLFWQQKRRWTYLLFFSAFWMYLLLVLSITVFPIPNPSLFAPTRDPAALILSRVNLVPLYYGHYYASEQRVLIREIVGNILLTVPFGFGISLIARFKSIHILWLGLAVGLSIELAQLGVSLLIGMAYRGVDINDVLFNAVGVWIGYGFFRGLAWVYRAVSYREPVP